MPVTELIDLSRIDLTRIAFDRDAVARVLPHRHEMALLDGVIHFDPEAGFAVGFHDARPDEFWVRGHIPGRPLLPGVLMIEAAGQLCGFYFDTVMAERGDRFFGFVGVENVTFRGPVLPGQRFHVVAVKRKLRTNSGVFDTQGYVDGRIVFEATIKGMVIR